MIQVNMKKIVNKIIRLILKVYNRLYFKNIEIIGRENIPDNGAILFSPNHQNALLDPILVGTTCQKSVYSLTRSDVFNGPLKWLLSAMQTLPIYRIRDGFEQLKKNNAIFEQCYSLLKNKKHMMMFSEGKHHDQYYLLRLSKGSSRLVLEAQTRASHTIYLQPVGINYGHFTKAGHRCKVVYGKPINVSNYLTSYKINKPKTINQLREVLQLAMEDCLWIPKNEANYNLKKNFINKHNTRLPFIQFKKELNQDPIQLIPNKTSSKHQKLIIWSLGLINFPVYLAIKKGMKKFDDHVFHGTVNYLGGLILFPLWWLIGFFVLCFTLTTFWGLGFFILSLITHIIRINYQGAFKY